jgi:peptidoglycan/xylan/chitin deacetylase (PgdA/CDA1 family)
LTHWGLSGLHGYTHEFVSTLNEQQQRDVLAKSIDVLTKFTGKKPKGWTAPAWNTSKETIRLLEEFGIVCIRRFKASVRPWAKFELRVGI